MNMWTLRWFGFKLFIHPWHLERKKQPKKHHFEETCSDPSLYKVSPGLLMLTIAKMNIFCILFWRGLTQNTRSVLDPDTIMPVAYGVKPLSLRLSTNWKTPPPLVKTNSGKCSLTKANTCIIMSMVCVTLCANLPPLIGMISRAVKWAGGRTQRPRGVRSSSFSKISIFRESLSR